MNPFSSTRTEQIKYTASVLIEKYYDCDNCEAGGSLHIVLDDKNISKEDVEYCYKYAGENDFIGQQICLLLLELSQQDLEDVVYNWSYIANDVTDYE